MSFNQKIHLKSHSQKIHSGGKKGVKIIKTEEPELIENYEEEPYEYPDIVLSEDS